MKKILSLIGVSLVLYGILSGCQTQGNPGETQQTEPTENSKVNQELFTQRDFRTECTDAVSIRFEDHTATSDSGAVEISGSTVTITGEGVYLLSGSLEDGTLVINANKKDKLQLVLDGVSIHSNTTAALEIQQADKVFLTLASGSENSLIADTVTQEADAALFSKQDLTINGSGSLVVTSPEGHGIVCKDDLVFTGGTCTVNAASHALDANDSVRITGETTLELTAGKDGIHCENSDDTAKGFIYIEKGTVKADAQGDAISAGAYAEILEGSFTLTAGGGSVNGSKKSSDKFGGFMGGRPGNRQPRQETAETEDSTSMKGLKATGDVIIHGGAFVIDAADDAIHADTSMTVSGGSFDIKTGDDAFHAEENLAVTDGQINVRESYEGLEAHKMAISGGQILIRSSDDGLNAAGGQDESGFTGGRDGMFGGAGGPGGHFGGGASDGEIRITGGKLAVYASGDGLDANGSIAISDGEIYVTNPSSGDTSVLDSDTGAVITGGRFIGVGASMMMAQSFDGSSTQGVLACSTGNQSAGTLLSVTDEKGNTVISMETEYNSVLLIVSTPEIVKGQAYTLTLGDTSGTMTAE